MLYNILIVLTSVTVVVWYIQYCWKRRKLYAMAEKINGPPALPLLGNALYFAQSNSGLLRSFMQTVREYKSPVKLWIGPELFIAVWKPCQLEVLLNSAHVLGKANIYKVMEPLVGNTSIFTADVPTWRRHRKIIMPTFNQNILNGFVEVFVEKAEILVQQLEKVSGKGEIDIYHYVSKCTLETICATAMGITINAQTTDCDFMKWINRVMEIAAKIVWLYWCRNDFILRRVPMVKEIYKLLDKIHNFTAAVVTEKKVEYHKKLAENKGNSQIFYEEDSNKRKTFLEHLIELSEEAGVNFTDTELRNEVDNLMIAGSDSTAITTSYAFIMLGMFPEVQDKVYREVLEVLGPDRPVEWKDLGKFVYLERVLKESMRLFPVAAAIARCVAEDVKVDNYTLPAGSTVAVMLLPLHRDPETWPEPLKFDPDRFLPEAIAKRHPYSWLAFSGGPRNCIGPKYAMMAMKTLVTSVVRKYKLSTTYKNVEDVELQFDFLLKPVHGYKLSIQLRDLA